MSALIHHYSFIAWFFGECVNFVVHTVFVVVYILPSLFFSSLFFVLFFFWIPFPVLFRNLIVYNLSIIKFKKKKKGGITCTRDASSKGRRIGLRGMDGKNFVKSDKTWVILFVCTTCKFINWQKEEIYDEKTGRGEKSRIIYRHAFFFFFLCPVINYYSYSRSKCLFLLKF